MSRSGGENISSYPAIFNGTITTPLPGAAGEVGKPFNITATVSGPVIVNGLIQDANDIPGNVTKIGAGSCSS